MPLTGDQERALALLREGWSTAEVAERIGLPRPVVWGWQKQMVEFRDTLAHARRDDSALFRGPFSREDKIRIAVPVLVVLISAFLFYLGYWR
ncbi:MAG TPA: helix-turn-helix domain-containing protein [Polyangiaceae bacterium]